MCQACLRANIVYVPTCQRGLYANVTRVNVPKACQPLIFTCQRANKRANVSYGVPMFQLDPPTYQTTCKFFNLACQRAKIHDTFSDIPLRKCNGKFLYFIVIKKFYIILDIIVIHIVSIWCIVHKSCIRFHFYTLFHSKEKCVEFFFFFFSFLGL